MLLPVFAQYLLITLLNRVQTPEDIEKHKNIKKSAGIFILVHFRSVTNAFSLNLGSLQTYFNCFPIEKH